MTALMKLLSLMVLTEGEGEVCAHVDHAVGQISLWMWFQNYSHNLSSTATIHNFNDIQQPRNSVLRTDIHGLFGIVT